MRKIELVSYVVSVLNLDFANCILLVVFVTSVTMGCRFEEDKREDGKHECLHESDEHFEPIKW